MIIHLATTKFPFNAFWIRVCILAYYRVVQVHLKIKMVIFEVNHTVKLCDTIKEWWEIPSNMFWIPPFSIILFSSISHVNLFKPLYLSFLFVF